MGDGRLISNTDLLILNQCRKWVHWVGVDVTMKFLFRVLDNVRDGEVVVTKVFVFIIYLLFEWYC